jgi:hypothetical protein
MVIAMVSSDRKFFAVEIYEKIKVKKLTLNFNSKISKYKNIMFTDINLFIKKLLELIKNSSDYELLLSPSNKNEYEMIGRLEKFCVKNNLSFLKNNTNSNSIDCYINNRPIQCKYCCLNNSPKTFSVSVAKCNGFLFGKVLKAPYNIDEPFDFIIVEVGGIRSNNISDKIIYQSNFCIIPKSELISQKILKSEKNKGKKTMSICAPDYDKYHWSKQYWNLANILL